MGIRYVIGEKLANGATVTHVSLEASPDGSTVEEMHDSHDNHTRTFTPAPGSPADVRATLERRLRDALVNNAAFLTTAMRDPQVEALTRQVDALIRFALNDYTTDKGT